MGNDQKGMLATTDIERGALIIAEKPLLTIPLRDQLLHFNDPTFHSQLRSLSSKHRLANARYSWNETRGEKRVYAVKKIRKGEEITVSYIAQWLWRKPRKERGEVFRTHFRFTSLSSFCRGPTGAAYVTNQRRLRIQRPNELLNEGKFVQLYPGQALSLCHEIPELYEAEGEAEDWKGEMAYRHALQICVLHSDFARAMSLAAKVVVEWRVDDSSGLDDMKICAKEPEWHVSAG
ncbi:hypothetical protein MMC30_007811 [Trapelia coarctata]|nr:hypothetical protein [Trapelia coarctata]